jgi:hypothetical protein
MGAKAEGATSREGESIIRGIGRIRIKIEEGAESSSRIISKRKT